MRWTWRKGCKASPGVARASTNGRHSQIPRQVGVGGIKSRAVSAVVGRVQDEGEQLWPISRNVGPDDIAVSGRHFWCFVHKQVVAGIDGNEALLGRGRAGVSTVWWGHHARLWCEILHCPVAKEPLMGALHHILVACEKGHWWRILPMAPCGGLPPQHSLPSLSIQNGKQAAGARRGCEVAEAR